MKITIGTTVWSHYIQSVRNNPSGLDKIDNNNKE